MLNETPKTPLEILRFLMEDELLAANHYAELKEALNDDEKVIIDDIIHDETVHFEQLRQLFIKRQPAYKVNIFDSAINESKELLSKN